MLAVVKDRKGPGFAVKDVAVPSPAQDEVLVRVRAVGICGTDLTIIEGKRDVPIPLIPGHEFAGEVVEVGSAVEGFRVGDRVTSSLIVSCGECQYCRQGMEILCDRIKEIGIHINGAFAEYVVVPQKTLVALPQNLTFEDGASMDPIASAYRAVCKPLVGPEDVVVVFGPGPIGLYALQVALAKGAAKVLCFGTKPDSTRLKVAEKLGAVTGVASDEIGCVSVVRDATGGRMADVAIDATGSVSALSACTRVLRKNGRVCIVGIPHDAAIVTLAEVVRKELRLYGSFCYTLPEFRASLELLENGSVVTEPVISHRLPLRDFEEALDLIYRREAVKVMLIP